MKDPRTPQAEQGREQERGKEDQSRRDIDLSLVRFRLALGRRLVERIMTDGLLTSVYDWFADLERVLSIMDSTLTIMKGRERWLSVRVLDEEAAQLDAVDRAERGGS